MEKIDPNKWNSMCRGPEETKYLECLQNKSVWIEDCEEGQRMLMVSGGVKRGQIVNGIIKPYVGLYHDSNEEP